MYYNVKVKVQAENDKGKLVSVKEEYIVEAISATDVEVMITELYKESSFDWSIDSLKATKIIDIIRP